jgi:hypothetical protein
MNDRQTAGARALDAACEAPDSANVPGPTYSISTWDHDGQQWYPRDRRATKWSLRCWIRKLYAESWDEPSILIERNG